MLPVIVAPSILSADFAELGADSVQLMEKGADWLHLDVMDGHFVPNLTFGPPVIAAMRQYLSSHGKPNVILDCHLMVSHPDVWVPKCIQAGASRVTWHFECPVDHQALIQQWRKTYPSIALGLAIKPGTPVTKEVIQLLQQCDLALVMTVEPGFGGQKFMTSCLDKVRELRQVLPEHVHIQVDGGVSPGETAQASLKAGANVLVSGTGVLGAKDWQAAMSALREL